MTSPHQSPAREAAHGYRFAPRTTRGLLLGLQPGQLLLIAVGSATFVFGLSRGPLGLAVGLLVGAMFIAVATISTPSGGRADVNMLLFIRHLRRRISGSSTTHIDVTRCDALQLPPPLHHLELHAAALPDGGEAGVLVERAAGRYIAMLAVSGASFTLRDHDDQARRVNGWGRGLAALARDGGALARVQWVARTSPADGSELLAHWASAGCRDRSLGAASYEQLVRAAGPATQAHETVLAACLDIRRSRRALRQVGGGDASVQLLLRELVRLADQLAAADVHVAGVLPPRGVARLLRTAYDPASQTAIDRRDAEYAGVSPSAAGPMRTETHWDCWRSDSGWHTTYWVAEWPRIAVGADFLAPLILAPDVRHTVAMVMEPLPTAAAARKLNAARTAETANATLRARVGQLTSERQRAEAEEVDRRERDLVAGHAVCRYAAFVTVTAAEREQLVDARGRIEHAAAAAHLELRLLYGQQDSAFLRTLPLAHPPR